MVKDSNGPFYSLHAIILRVANQPLPAQQSKATEGLLVTVLSVIKAQEKIFAQLYMYSWFMISCDLPLCVLARQLQIKQQLVLLYNLFLFLRIFFLFLINAAASSVPALVPVPCSCPCSPLYQGYGSCSNHWSKYWQDCYWSLLLNIEHTFLANSAPSNIYCPSGKSIGPRSVCQETTKKKFFPYICLLFLSPLFFEVAFFPLFALQFISFKKEKNLYFKLPIKSFKSGLFFLFLS